MNSTDPYQTLILGGGIAGLTVARELFNRGQQVAIVDGGTLPARTSSAAAGMLAPLVEARIEEREIVSFGRHSLEFYPRFLQQLTAELDEVGLAYDSHLGHRSEGTLICGVERDHLASLRHRLEEYRELGLPVEWLSASEMREREPYLAPGITGGIFSAADHQVDNRALLAALQQLLRHRGCDLIEGFPVESFDRKEDLFEVVAADGRRIWAEQLVIATGARTDLLARLDSAYRGLLRPVKGQIARLDQRRLHLLDHVVRTPEVYLVPKADGTIVLGASSEDQGFDPHVTLGEMFELYRSGWEVLPSLRELPILETSVGFRPATPDHAPAIGGTEHDALFLAVGYYRHGILFAPLAAHCLADLIIDKKLDVRIRQFSPQRFNLDPIQR